MELLHLHSKDIPSLAEKLQTQSEVHQLWLSPEIQNELLNIYAEHGVQFIIQCVTKAQEFGLIVDETTDISYHKIKYLVGQCYDGAANMSGCEKGVAARIQEVVPHALYVHCYAHRLNLALQDTLEANERLRNGIGVIQSLYNFFNSPKRQNILREVEGSDLEPFIKLKSLSKTRWVCHWEAVTSVERQIF